MEICWVVGMFECWTLFVAHVWPLILLWHDLVLLCSLFGIWHTSAQHWKMRTLFASIEICWPHRPSWFLYDFDVLETCSIANLMMMWSLHEKCATFWTCTIGKVLVVLGKSRAGCERISCTAWMYDATAECRWGSSKLWNLANLRNMLTIVNIMILCQYFLSSLCVHFSLR